MAERWIQAADIEEGALTRAARRAGMSMDEFCAQKNLSPLNQKRCNLRKTFAKIRPKGK